MGTNFYLKSKLPRIVEVYDEHHIAKTSMGWKPLFDASESGMESVEDIKDKFDTGDWQIVDEYGETYTWEQFEKRVLGHCPDGKSHGWLVARTDPQGYEFSKGGFL